MLEFLSRGEVPGANRDAGQSDRRNGTTSRIFPVEEDTKDRRRRIFSSSAAFIFEILNYLPNIETH